MAAGNYYVGRKREAPEAVVLATVETPDVTQSLPSLLPSVDDSSRGCDLQLMFPEEGKYEGVVKKWQQEHKRGDVLILRQGSSWEAHRLLRDEKQPSFAEGKVEAVSTTLKYERKGEVWEFDEHKVLGDGNCGFTSLGTTREEVCSLLLSCSGKVEMRRELAPEIKALLRENRESKLHTEDTRKLLVELDAAQLATDEQVRKLNSALEAVARTATPPRPYRAQTLDELIESLKDSPPHATVLPTLRAAHSRLFDLDRRMDNRCETVELFELYLREGLARTEWLGYRSAKLFAKLKQCNLYVFHPSTSRPGGLGLELVDEEECPAPKNTFYLLHTNRFTHYNLLSSVRRQLRLPVGDN